MRNARAEWRFVCLFVLVGWGCQSKPSDIPVSKLDHMGIHNLHQANDRITSGSMPEGDAGFQSLQKRGIKTIISVDGATPDVERAEKFGMSYVHLPFGYDGIPRERIIELAKSDSLKGPI